MQIPSYQAREDVPIEYTWDLTSIFARQQDWLDEHAAIQAGLPALATARAQFTHSGSALLSTLRQRDEMTGRVERLYIYALLRRDQDMRDVEAQGMLDQATELYVQVSTALSFIEPGILALSWQQIEAMITEAPALECYRHFFVDLCRLQEHARSSEIEAVLVASSEIGHAPETMYTVLNNVDLALPSIVDGRGETVALTQGNYQSFIRHADRRVRQDAFEAMHQTYYERRHIFAATLALQMKSDLFYTRQRHYRTCREHALARYNIPLSVHETLIATVREHIPLLTRYLQIRRRILQLDELHLYDLAAPLCEDSKEDVSYPQACNLLLQALAPLGDEYVQLVERAFAERWIDVYEVPGKHGGAYSSGCYGTAPFLLLNWQNTRKSMYTLAHELGHCLHSYLTRSHQPFHYGNYPIFIAEVASTVNEGLLTAFLLSQKANRQSHLALLAHALDDMVSKLFRQALSSEFEEQIHHCVEIGVPLTADKLITRYSALNTQYYGHGVTIDEMIGIEWARIPHFYYNYYVYQYATGISAATSLVHQILHEGKAAVERYRKFLCAGSSDYSIELLKLAGVDMTTSLPVRQTLDRFVYYVSQIEKMYAGDVDVEVRG